MTGKTLTELVEAALTAYVEQLKAPGTPFQAFERAGFVGIGRKGPKDLSRNYKRYLSKSLERKA